MKKREKTTDAVEIMKRMFFDGKPEMIKLLAEVEAEDAIARKIYSLRTKAGLSQAKLAKMIGTKASAISRLEDADYEGHSMSMLNKIAAALNKRVEIRFIPIKRKLAHA